MHDFNSDRKKRMISLRISEVEYELLKAQYRAYGARNISDLARMALERFLNGAPGGPDSLATEVPDLIQRIHTLESQVSLLVQRELVKT